MVVGSGQLSGGWDRESSEPAGAATRLALRAPGSSAAASPWARILDAGSGLLEEGGYEAFTIAALCERAQVPPRAIYDRADTKDALFLAVYEHGIARVRADQAVLADPARWRGMPADRLARAAVAAVADVQPQRGLPARGGADLRRASRGQPPRRDLPRRHRRALGSALGGAGRPRRAVRERQFCFSLVFSAMVLRTAYGAGYGPDGDVDDLTQELVTMARRYLRVAGAAESVSSL